MLLWFFDLMYNEEVSAERQLRCETKAAVAALGCVAVGSVLRYVFLKLGLVFRGKATFGAAIKWLRPLGRGVV